MSTNTFRYTTCCAANVYIFVYILIGAPIVPLKLYKLINLCLSTGFLVNSSGRSIGGFSTVFIQNLAGLCCLKIFLLTRPWSTGHRLGDDASIK